MLPLWKKIAFISLIILLFLYPSLSRLIFFWGKYIEHLFFLLASVVGIIIPIVRTIMYTIKLKKDNKTVFMNNWLYLQNERKKQKKNLLVLYLLFIPNIAFWIWVGSFTFNDVMLMTKDLPYVLSRNYPKVECFVKSNEFTHQSGYQHIQYITAINKKDKEYMFINFEHVYKKIDESSNYTIWYLPNTKLGVYAEKEP